MTNEPQPTPEQFTHNAVRAWEKMERMDVEKAAEEYCLSLYDEYVPVVAIDFKAGADFILKQQEGEGSVEKRADELLMKMFEENPTKLLTFFMSCTARQMVSANASYLDLSCDITVNETRYEIKLHSELNQI